MLITSVKCQTCTTQRCVFILKTLIARKQYAMTDSFFLKKKEEEINIKYFDY